MPNESSRMTPERPSIATPSGPMRAGVKSSMSGRCATVADASKSPVGLAALSARVARRYRACGRFAQHYVAAKLRRDPVHRAVLALAAGEALGDVVDVGCGRGQLG